MIATAVSQAAVALWAVKFGAALVVVAVIAVIVARLMDATDTGRSILIALGLGPEDDGDV